ncbi:hypothetical protein BV898_10698 [Hypsibius exemplaris]|uniref:Uncharacterized protein n=1 Tax=Hypsibius exemplaris TaxID=2072580 RepID=A0A1W0WIQ3_HYPEX|nr:hypothetical protein BV898_10698 [Hypsibius exemplaris]
MEYGRLSSLFWGQLDRERRELNEHSPANGEAYLTVSVSEWDALTTALVNQLPNKSLEKDAGSLLSAFRGLVKKNLDADAAHSQIDDTAASTLKALKECSVRMIGKKEKDALRKYFYAADSVDSFGQAALPIIRQLSELISQERWNEIWRTTLDRAQSSSRLITAFVENLQGVLTGGHDILQELELVPPQYGTATNKVLEEIKNCFIPEPVAVAPAKAAPPPKPEISRHTRSQPPSGTSGDLVRILLDTQFVSSDGSQPALDVFVPAVEGLLIGDKSEEELQSELWSTVFPGGNEIVERWRSGKQKSTVPDIAGGGAILSEDYSGTAPSI